MPTRSRGWVALPIDSGRDEVVDGGMEVNAIGPIVFGPIAESPPCARSRTISSASSMMSFALGNRSLFTRRVSFHRCRLSLRSRHYCPGRQSVAVLYSILPPRRQTALLRIVRATEQEDADALDEDKPGGVSDDWPMNWSLASYEDLSDYYGEKLLKEEGMGGYLLSDIMTKDLILTTPKTKREELVTLFEEHTGLPVVDGEGRLLGVVSRSDLQRKGDTVKDLMSKPPIAAKPTARVADAACLMLKHKVHRIPIVSKDAKVLGFVTRTDIFEALEAETEISEGIPK